MGYDGVRGGRGRELGRPGRLGRLRAAATTPHSSVVGGPHGLARHADRGRFARAPGPRRVDHHSGLVSRLLRGRFSDGGLPVPEMRAKGHFRSEPKHAQNVAMAVGDTDSLRGLRASLRLVPSGSVAVIPAENDPDRDRTCDLAFRKRSLYPTELRGRDAGSYVVRIARAGTITRGLPVGIELAQDLGRLALFGNRE